MEVLKASVVFLTIAGALGGEIRTVNNCGQRIFVKNEGGNTGGFFLNQGQARNFQLGQNSRARVWAHTGCDNNGNNCDTTEGYVSLAEMHWDDTTGMIGYTWYDISQVDGYNLPITMQPYKNSGGNCGTTNCRFDMNSRCPANSKVYKNNRVVGCRNLNRDQPTDYSRSIKASCPYVYSWSKDDNDGMRACNPGNNGLVVTFC